MTTRFTTEKELNKMRAAGRLAASVLEMIGEHIRPGVTTNHLNNLCDDYTLSAGATSAPLMYRGSNGQPPFPKSICTSVNHVVCHGIPSDKKLKKGDSLNIDVTVILDGYYGDTSKMFFVGKVPSHVERLAQIAQDCMYAGIETVRPGSTIQMIGYAIEALTKKNHVSSVRLFCGHGIGTVFHGAPQVPHYIQPKSILTLEVGQCFTIEPMINAGRHSVKTLGDQWTVVTKDRRLSAQWEHTILVVEDGYEILTLRDEES